MKFLNKRKITEKVNVRLEKDSLVQFLSFLYSVNDFRIFRIPELFTEQRNDKTRIKPSFSYLKLT